MNNIQITSDNDHQGRLTLHPKAAKALQIDDSQKGLIRFGIRAVPIDVYLSANLPLDKIRLSSDLIRELGISLNCRFDIVQNDNEIIIGPYIGILAGSNEISVNKRLETLLDYLHHYEKDIRGAVLVFSLENVDKAKLIMKGHLYNPSTNLWDEGTFPYPSSIMIKTGTVSSKWVKHFKSVIGDSVFNDFYFNKWDIHKTLEASSYLKNYLPVSTLYSSPHDIYSFLKHSPSMIVKSINASKGSSIYKISVDEKDLVITYPKTGQIDKIHLKNKDKGYSLFKRYFAKNEFMIQEALELITYQERTIDFRVIVIKNQNAHWQVMGIFARHGQPGNILSNLSPIVKSGEETIKEVLKLNDLDNKLLIQAISEIAIESVKAIDHTGVHFGNTGVDIAIDKEGNLRIIEIQHCNPSHNIAIKAGFPELYYEILKTNMRYAKRLAGFLK
ncbi:MULTISPECIES: YheC/YheD family protein [unclassified Bacillus (in: firmicutes)]|uniref:YheC/YheD family endospore coat-associated protein n=1 Tax=unclassified Bacillus (in: firmicutes) TaxID=185979 RepID=UPI0008ED3BA4|nr:MULTISPECIES: YheC/YheD family protein [unclassified Bacillus (in: firmicutes)]SFA86193.1 YheC/D like ATP-grasp [Bacillus sp. UNCCL13]SFQ83610.1 YheC/D like ATP-grasp [Bacillus sp. cl95]